MEVSELVRELVASYVRPHKNRPNSKGSHTEVVVSEMVAHRWPFTFAHRNFDHMVRALHRIDLIVKGPTQNRPHSKGAHTEVECVKEVRCLNWCVKWCVCGFLRSPTQESTPS